MKKQIPLFRHFILLLVCAASINVGFSQTISSNSNYIITKRLLSVEDGLPSRGVNDAVQDKDGFMWFATANGISRYDGNAFKNYNSKNSKLHFDDVVKLSVDANNRLYIHFRVSSALENPLNNTQLFDLNNYTFKNTETTQSGTSPNLIDSAQSLKQKQPLYLINKQNQWSLFFDNKYVIIRDIKDLSIEGENSIHSVFCDKLNNFWFSTPRGIYQVSIQANKFQHIFESDQINKFKFSTRGIYTEVNQQQEDKKRIYALSEFQNFRVQTKNGFTTLQAPGGYALLKNKDNFYISYNQLYKYNPANNTVRVLTNDADIGTIWSLASFSDSIILMGGSSGMLLYNENLQKTRPIRLLQNIKEAPVSVYRFLKSKQKGWIAVAENGIYFINAQLEIHDYYGSRHQQPNKRLPFTGIFDFYEDKQGIAWLAMNGEGLIRWNWNATNAMSPENIKKFTVNDGLPDDILYRIEEDDRDNLWISSYNGLLKFHKPDLTAKIYRAKDGLANVEFNRIASFKGDDGWMYFGGFNGIDAFDPVALENEKGPNNLSFQLVDFTKFSEAQNKLVDVLHDFASSKNIRMQVGDRFLTVSFALLDYEKRPHRYAYRIEGMDNEWNFIDQNTIRISGLPYGKLVLRVKAQLSSGGWNSKEIIIPIEVIKPYYLEAWFWAAAVLLLIGLFSIFYYIRINKLKRDKLKLESLIQKRTNSLSVALEDREMLLKEIHHRVKNNLQIITGLLQLQKDDLTDTAAHAALSEGQSRVSSIALIHQNLYQNKALGNIEFKVFLQDLSNQIAELFDAGKKKVEIVLHLPATFIDIDTAVPLGLIVNELLTNSYKYAFVNQPKPVIEIDLRKVDEGMYQLVYRDNGVGVKVPVEFENANTLGFRLISGLAKQLSGEVVYSFADGSVFTIDFKDGFFRKSTLD